MTKSPLTTARDATSSWNGTDASRLSATYRASLTASRCELRPATHLLIADRGTYPTIQMPPLPGDGLHPQPPESRSTNHTSPLVRAPTSALTSLTTLPPQPPPCPHHVSTTRPYALHHRARWPIGPVPLPHRNDAPPKAPFPSPAVAAPPHLPRLPLLPVAPTSASRRHSNPAITHPHSQAQWSHPPMTAHRRPSRPLTPSPQAQSPCRRSIFRKPPPLPSSHRPFPAARFHQWAP